jgi:hypothetical protein
MDYEERLPTIVLTLACYAGSLCWSREHLLTVLKMDTEGLLVNEGESWRMLCRKCDGHPYAPNHPALRSTRPWPGLMPSSCVSIAGLSKTVEGCTLASTASGGASRESVDTNTRVCDTSSRHRSNGITQGVVHAHGNRAAQNSGALGLSSAEVTILMQSNAGNREIVTLPPGGEAATHQPRCVCYLMGMITPGTF